MAMGFAVEVIFAESGNVSTQCIHFIFSRNSYLIERKKKSIFAIFFLHKMLTIFAKQLSWLSIFYKLHSYITMEIISRYILLGSVRIDVNCVKHY